MRVGGHQPLIFDICTIVSHWASEYPPQVLKMSLQFWLAGSVITDGIITLSMLYLVSSRHLS